MKYFYLKSSFPPKKIKSFSQLIKSADLELSGSSDKMENGFIA